MTNPNMHTENVSDDGEITDGGELSVATYYSPCVGIMNGDGYLRVVCDAPGHHTETRVDHATLINAGWIPPSASRKNAKEKSEERLARTPYSPSSLTPETDEAWNSAIDWCNKRDEVPDPQHVALANLAEKLERDLAAARKALTVCDGAMTGKVKPSSVAFKMIRAIMYPENH